MNGATTVLSGLFAGRYQIERELGRGGTAVVYLARDKQRGHDVAIKVLRPEFAQSVGAERFLKEIRLTEKLHHPHIVPVLDSGKHEGRLYFVLPYMEGGTLRQRLEREKQLTVDEVLAVTRNVASALEHAHAQGLIHRDVKPENILFTSGQACLADFGIARALERALDDTVTSTNIVRGTPPYMSPEQATGATELDGRSDVYSFGCVLYEMLGGMQPFVGPSPQSVIAQRLTHKPRPVRTYRPSLPRSIERVVQRALAVSPVDRYQTAQELVDALAAAAQAGADEISDESRASRFRLALLGGAAVLVIAAAAIILKPPTVPPTSEGIPYGDPRRVAVLYLDVLNPSSVPTYVADGLTEELIDRLGGVSALHVISPYGVRPYRASPIPLDSIGRVLRVGTIVAGSVARQGNLIRVNVRLVEAQSGRQLSSHTIEHPWSALFALQDTLANQVAFILRQRIGNEIMLRVHRSAAASYEAWELVQRASAEVRRSDDLSGDAQARMLLTADSLYARAEQIDGAWTFPTVRRGRIALTMLVQTTRPPVQTDSAAFARMNRVERRMVWIQRALDHANATLRRAPQSAEALSIRGEALFRLVTNGVPGADTLLRTAEQDLRSSVELRPEGADAWATLAQVLYSGGRFAEAAVAAQRAFDADAFFEVRRTVAVAFPAALYAGRFTDARRWCNFGLTHYAGDVRFNECELTLLGWSGRTRSDVNEAWRISNDIERRDTAGEHAVTWAHRRLMIAAALARAGMRDSARALLAAVQGRQRAPLGEAYVRLLLGDRDSALVHLNDYLTTAPAARAQIAQHPWFAELRGDARFDALVRPPASFP